MGLEEDLTKLSLAANTAIQDVQALAADNTDGLCKENVSSMISKARVQVLLFKDKIAEVERSAKLTDKEVDRVALEKMASNFGQELTRLNATLRQANLKTSAIIEKQEKLILMGGGESSLKKRIIDKQSASKGSSSITDSLVNTSKMMAEHLQRSNETIETLTNSSRGITATNEELKSMQGHIKNAKSLLTKYGRKENTDKLFIFLAVVFFLATVLYIMKKRLWSSTLGIDTYSPYTQDTSTDDTLVV